MWLDRVIGHRGCAGHAPENTRAGFQKAAQLGVGWVETDATLLQEGSVVLFHDTHVERCTDLSGLVRAQTKETLLKADAGGWFDQGQFQGQSVPLLKDMLVELKTLGLGLNLELKTHEAEGSQLADAVARILTDQPFAPLLVSSFDAEALRVFHHHHPHVAIGCLFDRLPHDWADHVGAVQAKTVHLWEQSLTQDQIAALNAEGLEVYAYTVNSAERAEALFQWGVTGVFSDYPDRI